MPIVPPVDADDDDANTSFDDTSVASLSVEDTEVDTSEDSGIENLADSDEAARDAGEGSDEAASDTAEDTEEDSDNS